MTLTKLEWERGKRSRTNEREFVRSKSIGLMSECVCVFAAQQSLMEEWVKHLDNAVVVVLFFVWLTTTFQFSLANWRKFTSISTHLKWRWYENWGNKRGGTGRVAERKDFSFPLNRRCLKSFNQFLLPTSVNGRKMKKMKTIWCRRCRC